MFSKTPPTNPPQGGPQPSPSPTPTASPVATSSEPAARPAASRAQKLASLIANDTTLEGSVVGGGELQIDGVIKGDVRVERVTVGDSGQVEGGIYAEAVEVRGKVTGSITAKQVRLYGACHVDGDITHEQLAMETGAFFQGRSLRLQRPATITPPVQPSTGQSTSAPKIAEPAPTAPPSSPSSSTSNGNGAKPASPAP